MKSIVKEKLMEELSKAYAPFTGCKIATVFKTQGGKYFYGHNVEHSADSFVHAEESALKNMKAEKKSKIDALYMTGLGPFRMKGVSPCNECFNKIKHHLSPKAKIILLEPNTFSRQVIFDRTQFIHAYEKLTYSRIKGVTTSQIITDLRRKTALSGKELKFIAALRLYGLKTGIHFYLTGSKSGRGGMGTLIYRRMRNTKSDLDLMAVTSRDRVAVWKELSNFIHSHFEISKEKKELQKIYFISETRDKVYYYDRTGRKVVDLCVGKTLRGAMSRMYYFKKNWWHQLS